MAIPLGSVASRKQPLLLSAEALSGHQVAKLKLFAEQLCVVQ